MPVEPICAARQATVVAVTRQYIRHAGQLFDLEVDPIPVTFELKGRAAGMYRVHRGERRIRYNPYIFAKYFEDNLANTVPHEVAHYITDLRYGLGNVRPHGREWQSIMHALGAEPVVTCRYDLSGIPVRRQRRYQYRCDCTTHRISSARHRRASSGQVRYFCKHCRTPIRLTDNRDEKITQLSR